MTSGQKTSQVYSTQPPSSFSRSEGI